MRIAASDSWSLACGWDYALAGFADALARQPRIYTDLRGSKSRTIKFSWGLECSNPWKSVADLGSLTVSSIPAVLVHYREQRLAAQIPSQIFGEQNILPFPQLVRRAGNVGRDQQILEIPKLGVFRQRLLLENIQGSATNFAFAQGFDQCVLIYERAATH